MASPDPATKERVLAVAAGKTDVGRRRDHNEDQILVAPELGLYAVADGMGGHQAGDVASSITAAALEAFFWDEPKPGIELEGFDGIAGGATRLVKAVLHCNKEVFGKSGRSANEGGMGSTVVAIYLSNDEESLHIAHVGDSRCYRIRDTKIELLTQDHSMINEALRLNPDLSKDILRQLPSNVVTRALGTKENVQPDVRTETLKKGDIYLLCSDGLSGEISDEDMLFGVLESEDLEDACDLLVAMANEAGGRDNISAVLVRVEHDAALKEEQVRAAISGNGEVDVDVDISGEGIPPSDDAELDAWLAEPDSDEPARPRRPAVPRPGARRKRTSDEAITRPIKRADLPAGPPTPTPAEATTTPVAASAAPIATKPPRPSPVKMTAVLGKRGGSRPPTPPVEEAARSEPGLLDEESDDELNEELDQELGKPLDRVEARAKPLPDKKGPPRPKPRPKPAVEEEDGSIFEAPLNGDVEALTALEPPFGNEPARARRHSEPPEPEPEPEPELPPRPIMGVPVVSVGEPVEEPEEEAIVLQQRCESCGHKLLPEEKFCGMCGTRVRQRTVDPSVPRCDACGSEVLEDTRFCIECGVRLESG